MKTIARHDISWVIAMRPTERELEQEWTTGRKEAVWERVLLARQLESETGENSVILETLVAPQRMSRRKSLIVVGSVAAAVAALLTVPLLLPSGGPVGPPSAQALEALAAAAAGQRPLAPGQFRHEITRSQQNGHVTEHESWTAADGHLWRVDSIAGTSTYYAFPPGEDDVNNPSRAFLETLPTDPAALQSYLEANVHGSSSRDEAVFVAVGDMLRGGFAPPALRAAALRVLEKTPHVTAEPGRDSAGRAATVVRFVDESIRPGEVQSLYFDPATAAILQEGLSAAGVSYRGTVVSSDIVSSVPPQVIRYASTRGPCVTAAGVTDEMTCVLALTAGGATTMAEAPGSAGASAAPSPSPVPSAMPSAMPSAVSSTVPPTK